MKKNGTKGVCKNCNTGIYIRLSDSRKFCSSACYHTYAKKSGMGIVWHPIKCGYCLCSFLVIGTRFNKRRQFCSRKCAGLFKIGKHHSGGNKIREALQGVPKSKAHIEKVRMALTGRIRLNMRGEKNHNWTGGGILTEQIRKCTRNKEWKVKCLIRDGRQCVKCFENKQSELEIDHIIPFSFLLKE